MPPYWALGLHLCRSSCSLPDWNQTIAKLLSIPIPIESDCGSSNKITDKASMLKWIINLRRNRIKWLSIERPHLLLDRIETNSLHSDWFDKVLMDLNHKSFRPYIGSINECKEMAKKGELYLVDFGLVGNFFFHLHFFCFDIFNNFFSSLFFHENSKFFRTK